ncbi:thiolase family protein [Paraconexibacter antarcticus]|uniref:Thiolase family protein n=1 Tax=Paraconexibacter antarcticus TaxID=2949664 RepID=A0ABY5DZC9_9ACTN|nr:thiolase family protein [Paraconexibacter antarcticus]UTI66242.1 thiolase family protein [Paraconexibacter antarcticus]
MSNVTSPFLQHGREVFVVDAVRTPIGRAHPEKGAFRDTHAVTLLRECLTALMDRSGIEPAEVDDVMTGCVNQFGEQSRNIARSAWLAAGYPYEVPATTVDRRCGSAQSAMAFAAAMIASGTLDVVVAAGVEHMQHIPIDAHVKVSDLYGSPWPPDLLERYDFIPQGLSAELIADRWDISREAMDELAVGSHARAVQAAEEGRFARELVPVETPHGTVALDQGLRPTTSMESLGALRTVFKEDGRITAGTSSQLSDGASAVLFAGRDAVDRLGLVPRARIVDQVTVGVDPIIMLTGPIPATRKLLRRTGLTIDDLDLMEVNEAFASVVLAWQRELGADLEKTNVNGGAMALGHPVGSTGTRLTATLLNDSSGPTTNSV